MGGLRVGARGRQGAGAADGAAPIHAGVRRIVEPRVAGGKVVSVGGERIDGAGGKAGRGAGVAGKLAQAALDTTAALGARAKPTCTYLHATYVPRHLGYMDVVTEVSADMQQAAEEALRAAAGETAGSHAPARLGQLQPSQVSMQTSQEYDGHVQVAFSLSPVSQLLAAMVQAQVQSHSARVR